MDDRNSGNGTDNARGVVLPGGDVRSCSSLGNGGSAGSGTGRVARRSNSAAVDARGGSGSGDGSRSGVAQAAVR